MGVCTRLTQTQLCCVHTSGIPYVQWHQSVLGYSHSVNSEETHAPVPLHNKYDCEALRCTWNMHMDTLTLYPGYVANISCWCAILVSASTNGVSSNLKYTVCLIKEGNSSFSQLITV